MYNIIYKLGEYRIDLFKSFQSSVCMSATLSPQVIHLIKLLSKIDEHTASAFFLYNISYKQACNIASPE